MPERAGQQEQPHETAATGVFLRIIAELRTTAKDFGSMGYGLFQVRLERLAAEVEDGAKLCCVRAALAATPATMPQGDK